MGSPYLKPLSAQKKPTDSPLIITKNMGVVMHYLIKFLQVSSKPNLFRTSKKNF